MFLRLPAICVCLCMAQAAVAADRNPDAHVHGVSQLNAAIDGSRLEVELVSPAADVVGFEHPPATPEERVAVERAAAVLRAGDLVLGLPGSARCNFTKSEVESGLIGAGPEIPDKKNHDNERRMHAEFHAYYRLDCEAPDRLTHIEFRAFKEFPNMREVEARALTPAGQRAAELTPLSPRLDL